MKNTDDFKLGVCLCALFIFLCWLFTNDADFQFNGFSENKIAISEPRSGLKIGKSVSSTTSSYIQQAKMCTLRWNELAQAIKVNYQDFSTYSDELNMLLKEIELLNKKSISKFDDLKTYENVSKSFYGCMFSFFASVKEKQSISFEEYTDFALEINALENPHEHLVKLFDEHGYYYTVDDDKTVHYKVGNSLI